MRPIPIPTFQRRELCDPFAQGRHTAPAGSDSGPNNARDRSASSPLPRHTEVVPSSATRSPLPRFAWRAYNYGLRSSFQRRFTQLPPPTQAQFKLRVSTPLTQPGRTPPTPSSRRTCLSSCRRSHPRSHVAAQLLRLRSGLRFPFSTANDLLFGKSLRLHGSTPVSGTLLRGGTKDGFQVGFPQVVQKRVCAIKAATALTEDQAVISALSASG